MPPTKPCLPLSTKCAARASKAWQLVHSGTVCRSIDDFKQVLLVNVVGTFSVTKSVLHLLKLGIKKTIVHISSNAASLSRNHAYIQQEGLTEANLALSYRASKVAINMGKICWCSESG